jgi:hypothetical protein
VRLLAEPDATPNCRYSPSLALTPLFSPIKGETFTALWLGFGEFK